MFGSLQPQAKSLQYWEGFKNSEGLNMLKHSRRGKQMTITATLLDMTFLSCTSWPDASANPLEWQESHLCAEP